MRTRGHDFPYRRGPKRKTDFFADISAMIKTWPPITPSRQAPHQPLDGPSSQSAAATSFISRQLRRNAYARSTLRKWSPYSILLWSSLLFLAADFYTAYFTIFRGTSDNLERIQQLNAHVPHIRNIASDKCHVIHCGRGCNKRVKNWTRQTFLLSSSDLDAP